MAVRYGNKQKVRGGVRQRAVRRLNRVGPVAGVNRRDGITGREARLIRGAWQQERSAQAPGSGGVAAPPASGAPGASAGGPAAGPTAQAPGVVENPNTNLFNSALERMRAGGQLDIEAANAAHTNRVNELNRRFFDPVNEFSEANQIALANQVATRRMMNTGANTGQIFSGSQQNAEQIVDRQRRQATADAQQRYNELVAASEQQRLGVGSDVRRRIEDAGFAAAQEFASNPAYTDAPLSTSQPSANARNPNPAQSAQQGITRATSEFRARQQAAGKALARQLMQSGHKSGPRWKQVINMLGYDPRKGGRLQWR